MNILAIDDSKTAALMIKNALKEHQVTTANNGEEGISAIKLNDHFDLVLLDWQMPIMDGPGFLKVLQADRFTYTPIIVLTAEQKIEKIFDLMKLGVDVGVIDYINKPFTPSTLQKKIRDIQPKVMRYKAFASAIDEYRKKKMVND
ncbi:MAG: response regulator [Oligoflexia bacterium]|nr:response regulator [Oligoflexia bacterium]